MEQFHMYSHAMSDVPSNRSKGSGRPAGDGERSSAPTPALDALLSGPVGDPVRRALWLDALDRRLHALLPPELAVHARLANVDGSRLVYLVDSPVWHARLRMASAGLLDAARSVGLDVTDLVVRTTTRPTWREAHATTAGTPARRSGTSAVAGKALRAALASLDTAEGDVRAQEGPRPDSAAEDSTDPSRTAHPNGAKDA
jgi:hypothetical protein